MSRWQYCGNQFWNCREAVCVPDCRPVVMRRQASWPPFGIILPEEWVSLVGSYHIVTKMKMYSLQHILRFATLCFGTAKILFLLVSQELVLHTDQRSDIPQGRCLLYCAVVFDTQIHTDVVAFIRLSCSAELQGSINSLRAYSDLIQDFFLPIFDHSHRASDCHTPTDNKLSFKANLKQFLFFSLGPLPSGDCGRECFCSRLITFAS